MDRSGESGNFDNNISEGDSSSSSSSSSSEDNSEDDNDSSKDYYVPDSTRKNNSDSDIPSFMKPSSSQQAVQNVPMKVSVCVLNNTCRNKSERLGGSDTHSVEDDSSSDDDSSGSKYSSQSNKDTIFDGIRNNNGVKFSKQKV